ncbi:MAG TPA: MbcA/ParS/Xre antitoxin family protein [Ramlibacter sp.]|uniref:MbcA/ParS/Xre antitoxin family protein n=1 Tax=Ramlibacter sp. TaxID=1917967 RepID=UPI002D810620|nr:MbcA/ParS/Xre antitoxin family protein [Ramlibacter sp.]HET8744623.1 MbcA/ParS/Xre antitoxin family protein [Ramlibacter sp.]
MADAAIVCGQVPAGAAVLTKATLRAAELLGLTNAALARVVGLSESQVSRMSKGEKALELGSKPAELAALLVRVYRSLDALVGNSDAQRKAWMASFNRAFNEPPREAILKVDGLVRVVNYLDGARAVV